MSNYRTFDASAFPAGRAMTPKQRRRFMRKQRLAWLRDPGFGRGSGNPSRPRGLSGHPGRRREQLAQREALAGFRYLAAVRRRLDTASKPAGPPVDKRRAVQLQELIVRRPS